MIFARETVEKERKEERDGREGKKRREKGDIPASTHGTHSQRGFLGL